MDDHAPYMPNSGIEYKSRPEEWIVRLRDVEMLAAGGGSLQQGQQLTYHFTLIALLSGEGQLKIGKKNYPMLPGTAYICWPGHTFGVVSADMSAAIIRFDLYREQSGAFTQLDGDSGQEGLLKEGAKSFDSGSRLADACRSMHAGWGSGQPLKRMQAQIGLQQLLLELLAASGGAADTREGLEQAKAYMEQHSSEALTMERLAAIAAVSPKYFAELFKKTYGVSAHEHMAQIRMAKAKRLMLHSGRKLRDIAHEVGYEDEFYFSRKFKKEHGLSPTQFMNRRKRKIAVYGPSVLIGYLLPLHVIPYAAPLHPKWADYYYDHFAADIPFHLDGFRQNYRKAANMDMLEEAKPELIMCPPGLEDWEKERLQAIAPYFELPEVHRGCWKNTLRSAADWLDERPEAERWITAFERGLALAKDQTAGELKDESVLFVCIVGDQLYASCSQGVEDILYNGLGIRRPCGAAFSGLYHTPLTVDQLSLTGADRIILLVRQDTESLEYWRKLRMSPGWLSLDVVRNGKLMQVSSSPWREYSPIALERMLGEAVQLFSGNCP
ncbi:helix-turn-helix domain-containing protein [Paenibacillus protaetiae]|uniref:Helix-turn-helix domain-containing protein n=1 Tax=Paenibacillus protaetiae TaxID=2509456 RepID=A0A4P6EUQ0_9BACL|nr:helix-turn-helix domain-containing protein [Paenibacillus protaetiae]QAY66674.1 helix-turn-helix domain-containing protein [Paenibacillus protaetiae]